MLHDEEHTLTGYYKYNDGEITEIDYENLPDEPVWKNEDFRQAIKNDPHGCFYGDLTNYIEGEMANPNEHKNR